MIRTAPPELASLAGGIVRWLVSCQDADGNLRDLVSGERLPHHHYALSLFAAACTLTEDSAGRLHAASNAVRYYLSIPDAERGAHELNCLGLLCVLRRWRQSNVNAALWPALEQQLRRWPFASLRGHVTNNWHAMRAACLAQRAILFDSNRDRELAIRCLHEQVLPRQGPDAMFADYPPRPSRFPLTPLTYHANFCAMLAMLLQDTSDHRAATALSRGLAVLARLCAPNGESLYFGRSCNSLYGYSAAIYACRQALHLGILTVEEQAYVAETASRMTRFVGQMAARTGPASTYPTPYEREQLAWDNYVNRLDYNAFAAFLLLQLSPEPSIAHQRTPASLRLDTQGAGLMVRGTGDVFAAFSTHGQMHTGSYMFVDARYSGMQVLALHHNGRAIIPPPPHDASSPSAPDWIGFMPVIGSTGVSWAVRRYEDVVIAEDESTTTILARGVPVSLRPFLRANGNTSSQNLGSIAGNGRRLARRVLQLLHLPVPPAYRSTPLAGVEVRRAIVLAPHRECLVLVDQVSGPFERAWATVRVSKPWALDRGGLRIEGGPPVTRVRPSEGDGAETTEVRTVYTSNGSASVLRLPLVNGIPRATIVAFGPQPAPDFTWEHERREAVLSFPAPRAFRLRIDLDSLQVRHE